MIACVDSTEDRTDHAQTGGNRFPQGGAAGGQGGSGVTPRDPSSRDDNAPSGHVSGTASGSGLRAVAGTTSWLLDSGITGGYGKLSVDAWRRGDRWWAIGYQVAGVATGVGWVLTAGQGGTITSAARTARDALGKEAGSIRSVNAIGGKSNCVNCAVATDATLAGRPASALGGGPFRIDALERMFGGRFGAPGPISSVSEALTAAGPGARGIVFGSRGNGNVGHVFNAVNQNGVVRFLDGQTGRAASLEGFQNFQLLRTN